MCLALPSRVLQVDGMTALIEAGGQQRAVNLMLLDEPVAVGDYLLVHHAQFAFERLDPEHARAALTLIENVVAESGDTDVASW